MSFAFIPGISAFTTTSLSVSKMSTEGTYVVVDSGSSQSLPQKASRVGSVLNSRKGSHLMSDIVLSPFRSSLVAASAYRYAFGIPRTYVAAARRERLIYRGFYRTKRKSQIASTRASDTLSDSAPWMLWSKDGLARRLQAKMQKPMRVDSFILSKVSHDI